MGALKIPSKERKTVSSQAFSLKVSGYRNWPLRVCAFLCGKRFENVTGSKILGSDIYAFAFCQVRFDAAITAAMQSTSQIILYTWLFKRVSVISQYQRNLRFLWYSNEHSQFWVRLTHSDTLSTLVFSFANRNKF